MNVISIWSFKFKMSVIGPLNLEKGKIYIYFLFTLLNIGGKLRKIFSIFYDRNLFFPPYFS